MVSRQWFIGVKSNTDKQKNRLRHPYTDFKSRRAKSAPAVSRTILRKLRAAVGGSGASSHRTLQGANNPPPLAQIVKAECGVCGTG